MPNTGKGYPYPAATDTPDVPRDVQALAVAIDDRLPKRIKRGTATVTVTASVNGTATVTFTGTAFAAAPDVLLTPITQNAYSLAVSGITTTGFTINARHIDATSATTTFTVQWVAIEWA